MKKAILDAIEMVEDETIEVNPEATLRALMSIREAIIENEIDLERRRLSSIKPNE